MKKETQLARDFFFTVLFYILILVTFNYNFLQLKFNLYERERKREGGAETIGHVHRNVCSCMSVYM